MKRLLIIFATILARQICAQDIMSGYTQTKRIPPFTMVVGATTVQVYTYSITVILYSDASKNIVRPTIPMNFGDGNTGTFSVIATSNQTGINKKTYAGTYTYAGPGNYGAFFLDTFRIAGIRNMFNSQTQKFYVRATIIATNLSSINTSPAILFDPINIGGSNQLYYNFGCSDTDGDSLSFQMYMCYGTNWYQPNNSSINNSSGLFSFSNDTTGIYSFAFEIREWRKNTGGQYQIIGITEMDFIASIAGTIGFKEQTLDKSKLNVFPNPATNELFISIDKIALTNSDIEIFNSIGQSVLKTNYADKINISNLPNDIYTLKLSDKNISTDSFKFIKD